MEANRRNQRLGAAFDIVWVYGRSGAGKTTLAQELQTSFRATGLQTVLLDGDQVRDVVTPDRSLTDATRQENLRRSAEISRLLAEEGLLVICAFTTPLRAHRAMITRMLANQRLLLVYASAPAAICTARGSKSPFRRLVDPRLQAHGYETPFEEPDPMENALIVDTHHEGIAVSTEIIRSAVMVSRTRA